MDHGHVCIDIIWQQNKKERQLYLLNSDDVYIDMHDHKRRKKCNLLRSDQLRLRNHHDYISDILLISLYYHSDILDSCLIISIWH